MDDIIKYIQNLLFSAKDQNYREFNSKLIPTVEKERIIGVRTPELRKMAKQLANEDGINIFLDSLPHYYFEENNLHAFIIEQERDFNIALSRVDKFLPYVDNWATCDQLSPKIFKKYPDALLCKCHEWLDSGNTYTIRYGIGVLMRYFLDGERFNCSYLKTVGSIKSDEYYVKMMQAWYFATALAKQYESTLQYFEKQRLDEWTHNKAIQKALESYRLSPEQKDYLRKLKIK